MDVMHAIGRNGHSVFLWPVVLLAALSLAPITAECAVSIADPDITDHLASEFLFDHVVPFNIVDVNTNNGIVTLTGTVTNLLAKERATQIVETVRGVRSIVNHIDVDPVVDMSGRSLRKVVNDALLNDAATDSYEINVSADDKGRISLSDTVHSWQDRGLAEAVAKKPLRRRNNRSTSFRFLYSSLSYPPFVRRLLWGATGTISRARANCCVSFHSQTLSIIT